MTVDLLLQYLTWGLFVLIFLSTLVEALRYPTSATVNVALLFGVTALIIVISAADTLGLIQAQPVTGAASSVLLLALPVLLIRLAGDFSQVPVFLTRFALVAYLGVGIGAVVFAPPRPFWYNLLAVVYFVGLQFYATAAFARESRRSGGVTRRRLRAIAVGAVFLGLAILVAGLLPWLGSDETWLRLFEVLGLASAISYYLGFSPPLWLRRSWQQPEVNSLVRNARLLIHLPDLDSVRRELERGVADSLGASRAHVGLWDEKAKALEFQGQEGPFLVEPDSPGVAARSFVSQQPVLSTEIPSDDSPTSQWRRAQGVKMIMAAPITGGDKIGALVTYALRPSIFVRDDLDLLQLLADQAAVVLEAHTLIEERVNLRAVEETVRLRDEFLSAAAHDLKNPLTSIAGYSQLTLRRAERSPDSPADIESLRRIYAQALRMTRMIDRVLDASRAEEGRLVVTRSEVDLSQAATEVADSVDSDRHRVVVDAPAPVVGWFDRNRVMQLLENLVANAVKYSPDGGEIRIGVWREEDEARLTVSDQGIGIPEEEIPHIFDRFSRASNTETNQVEGTGLGLFICQRIVEEHGGRIWAASTLGKGTIFHLTMPLGQEDRES